MAGCVAQAEGAEILRKQRAVDLVVGPQNYHRLPDLVRESVARPVVDTEFPVEDKFDHLTAPSDEKIRERGVSAFLTVQEGCDKFCTFCVVPYTRGAEVSRPAAKIVAEAEILARAGVREITLLGQNVDAYHGMGEDGAIWSLARLLRRLAQIEGILRLRFTTSHPNDMTDDLIEAFADLPALMPFLHLPVQSGSDAILEAMNRRHSARGLHSARRENQTRAPGPGAFVGFHRRLSRRNRRRFPGHARSDLRGAALLRASRSNIRPGRARRARTSPTRLTKSVKTERLYRLQELVERQRQQFNASLVGQITPVLFEKPGRHDGQVAGKSPYLQPVQIDGSAELIGRQVPVEIVRCGSNSLFGRLVETGSEGAA